jgi:biotin transporter BioY
MYSCRWYSATTRVGRWVGGLTGTWHILPVLHAILNVWCVPTAGWMAGWLAGWVAGWLAGGTFQFGAALMY